MKKYLNSSASVIAVSIAALIANNASAQEVAEQEAREHGHDVDVVFVTATPHAKSQFDVLQGSSVLSGDDLSENLEATIGETLSGLPGISSTSFGAGASRPIIRGLGGDRIRVLVNGIGSIDASSTSPDHAVAAEPLTAQRIEILRGASTLVYGNNAVGGVVNIIDSRIPTIIPENGVTGKARLSGDTAADDRSAAAAIDAALADKVVLHVDGFYRNTNNFSIPGFAESAFQRALEEEEHHDEEEEEEEHEEHEEEEQFGFVENSDLENKGGTFGIGFVGEDWNFGASFNLNDSNYGVPGHSHAHHEEEHEDEEEEEEEHEEHGEEPVRIDLDQKRFDLAGGIQRNFAIFQEARLRFGYADYEHTELEGDEVGTIFANEGWEGRMEFIQQDVGNLHGSMGVQIRDRSFSAIGEEAFTPPNDTRQVGLFVVEELEVDTVTFDLGGRWDHQRTKNAALNIERTFNSFSFSSGAALHVTENDLFGVSYARTQRAPTPEELYSNGPHLATSSYEVGNLNLGLETANSLEVTLKRNVDRFTGSINVYRTWYDNFVYQRETGEEMDELHVLEYAARDATFTGAEAEFSYLLADETNYTIALSAAGDFVHARFNNDEVVPRMPASSVQVGLDYASEYVDLGAEVRYVGSKTKTAEDVLPTNDYVNIDLSAAWKPFGNERDLSIRLQALNITDSEQREHTSLLKDLLPRMGANFRLTLDYGF